MVNYRSVSDLDGGARRLARQLSPGVDVVVGIPRSGLLAANLLCLHLNCPVTDVDGLLDRRLLASGNRLDDGTFDWEAVGTVLVVDDSINTGRSMERTRARIERAGLPFDVEYAAIYITPGGYRHVDYWVEVVRNPRVFGWNLTHHPMLRRSCVVADGVLWRRPTAAERRSEAAYRHYLASVGPLAVPTKRVGWLVTARPPADRDRTEAWLDAHGVDYDRLVMLGPSDDGRTGADDESAAKAALYASTDAKLLVEASAAHADEIARLTRRPVYCYETDEMLENGALTRTRIAVSNGWRSHLEDAVTDPLRYAATTTRRLLVATTDGLTHLTCRVKGR